MKLNSSNLLKYMLAVALASQVGVVRAEYQIESLRSALSKVPVAEVPAEAAELVSKASIVDRDVVAADVVKLVFKSRPTITVATVGLISSKCPQAAPTAAATAAKLQPKQFKLIAKAAAFGAPSQAGAIVRAVCQIIPAHSEVALAVAEGAPNSTMDIVEALGDVMPKSKTRLDVAVASFHGNVPSVSAVLYRANSLGATGAVLASAGSVAGPTAPTLRGPAVGPPYIPLSGTPSYVPPGGGIVPPGGRDYAAP